MAFSQTKTRIVNVTFDIFDDNLIYNYNAADENHIAGDDNWTLHIDDCEAVDDNCDV